MAAGDTDHSAWIAARDARLRAAGALDGDRKAQAPETDWGLRLALWLKPAADAINSLPERAAAGAQSVKEVLYDGPQKVMLTVQYTVIGAIVLWAWKRMRS